MNKVTREDRQEEAGISVTLMMLSFDDKWLRNGDNVRKRKKKSRFIEADQQAIEVDKNQ